MLGGILGLVAAGTAAALQRLIAKRAAGIGFSAIGFAATDDSEMAAFADGGAAGPVGERHANPGAPQAGGDCLGNCHCQRGHRQYYRTNQPAALKNE